MSSANAKSVDVVFDALTKRPDATAAELSGATGLAVSTVGKMLALLESDGKAARHKADAKSAATWRRVGRKAKSSNGRLKSGELRDLVFDHLRDHAGEVFTPFAVGEALDRSSGAVANALEKLTGEGDVARVSDKPKRYAFTEG